MSHAYLVALLLMFASPCFAENDDTDITCPLTKSYMLEMLNSLKGEITNNTYPIPDSYYEHATRMAKEIKQKDFSELRAEIKSDNKSCSYFWIAVHIGGVNDFSPEGRSKEMGKLELNVKKCIQWVNSHQFTNENNIESEFCK